MRKLFFESFLATVLVFIVLGLLALFPLNIKVFNPIKELLKDFKYTDIYYSKFYNNQQVDTAIAVVNVGQLDRFQIANLLELIQEDQPKVVGVDIFFRSLKEPIADSLLQLQLNRENIVTPVFLHEESNLQNHPFFKPATVGYVNFVSSDSLISTIRYFRPYYEVEREKLASFSTKVAAFYAPEVEQKLTERDNDIEIINYYGDYSNFLSLEGSNILAGEKEVSFKDKIVILGYIGNQLGRKDNLEDLFFTPLNKETIGRSLPDMYGAVIHANVIHMLLHEQYIDSLNNFVLYSLTFLICLIHVVFFIYFFVKQHLWYHLFAKIAQLISSLFLLWICLVLFANYNFKIENTLLIIGVLLAVDVLYLYESLAAFIYRKYHLKSYFIHEH